MPWSPCLAQVPALPRRRLDRRRARRGARARRRTTTPARTIEFIVGGDSGGGYDIYARAVARHLARHIPGNPTIVVKNMPGAGSTRAGIYISTVAPKDGGSIGALMPGAIIGPLLEDKPMTQFDPTKVIYIGTADSGVRVCATFQNSKINTFAAAQKNKTILGASSAGGATRDYAYLHNHTAGTKFSVVAGYKGTVDIALAMERGEVDGLCGWDWSSVKSQKGDWVRDKKLNLLVQVGLDAAAGADRPGRADDLDVRQERERPPGRRAGRQPAGVPALLHRAAGHAARSRSRSCAPPSTRR